MAFGSPNIGVLGEVGVNFNIHWGRVLRHRCEGSLKVFTDMSEDVSIINISPCINLKVVYSIFRNSKAVVINAYGMGNIPSDNQALLNLIREASQNDVIIVIKTQCNEGGVETNKKKKPRHIPMG